MGQLSLTSPNRCQQGGPRTGSNLAIALAIYATVPDTQSGWNSPVSCSSLAPEVILRQKGEQSPHSILAQEIHMRTHLCLSLDMYQSLIEVPRPELPPNADSSVHAILNECLYASATPLLCPPSIFHLGRFLLDHSPPSH